MVPRGPSFEIGSAHAQRPRKPQKRPSHPRSRLRSAPSSELALRLFQRHEKCAKSRCTMRCVDARPTRARACVARRPANSRYSDSPSSELALRLFQRHEKSTITLHNALRCIVCSNEERAVPRTRINFVPAPRRVY